MTATEERQTHAERFIDAIDERQEEESELEDFDSDDAEDAVDQQDWAESAGDFTKKYNRLKNHVSIVRHDQNGAGILPATNQTSKRQAEASNDKSSAKTPTHTSKVDLALASLSHQYSSQVDLAPLYSSNVTGPTTRKGGSERILTKDKSDRATNEQVMDDRTRLVLFKMLGRGLLSKVEGCVSTGKEANVYHALSGDMPTEEPLPSHLAIKIYKTSILVFKDRDRYVTGEFRFKGGYARSNPRKMVRLWAEKELRNLRRLHSAGINCPVPIEVRENVLVMSFLGQSDDGWEASPRLKDAEIRIDQLETLYIEMLHLIRVIYQQCKLVHADLSEYNVIYHKEHLYIIDVSQSVEQDHPHAFDFLRSDITNMDEFFQRRGVATIGLKRTFDMTLIKRDDLATMADIQAEVERLRQLPSVQADGGAQDAAVFAQSFIPRTLNEVYDPERDADLVQKGEGGDLIYASHMGIAGAQETISTLEAKEDPNSEESSDSDDSANESENSDSNDSDDFTKKPKGKKFEDKDAKKERKQAVKDERAEKRKTKMSKSEKKRRVAKTSGKRK